MTSDADLEAFGRALRHWRKQQGISQEELAGRADLHRNYVGLVERGERNASIKSMFKLAQALGISVAQLCSNLR
ncbi:MAG: helix-turn-helix transcriptional regulator [Phenylobacterium sp.]|uniref:helix-turn-helix domain-containing protein n=1 Tax=Phenylobacterium sp. TaxID=1871053 RepID=UPI002717167B|nr:helix-turn-helix transcriptional regulator [Phenylobacterium sp.]MDO8913976.1 helix-turn-helix transcriptional regulator [Phenylobacterium sp.]MDP3100341.1 helix-turn-helix transcriptional regulator [Phenylobacterium sp.]